MSWHRSLLSRRPITSRRVRELSRRSKNRSMYIGVILFYRQAEGYHFYARCISKTPHAQRRSPALQIERPPSPFPGTNTLSNCLHRRRHSSLVGALPNFLLPPLPLHQRGQEMPQVKFRPETVEKANLCVFVTLPKHEVGKSSHARGSDQQI